MARYRPQGFFKLHTDHVEAFNRLVCGGRLGTLIIYLNDDFTGGQTNFPYVKATVEPCTGDAIYFHSVVVSSLPHERASALCLTLLGMQLHALNGFAISSDDAHAWTGYVSHTQASIPDCAFW